MIKHISSTFLLVVVINYLSAQNITTLRIDPDNARGGTASQIFDSLQFIPLETTKESLFGSIDQLEVTDSLFFILDIRSRSVLIFRRDGSLHARIISDGPNKYFGYFALDRKANRIIIDNNYANGLLVYDFNGNLLPF
jgi:6-bladed beta-propeller